MSTESVSASGPSYRVPAPVYQRALGTLHPSCVLPDDGLTAGDRFQLREHHPKRDEDTGNAMFVTTVRVERMRKGKAPSPVCRVQFAVNTIVQP
jgi:hypothetical protein